MEWAPEQEKARSATAPDPLAALLEHLRLLAGQLEIPQHDMGVLNQIPPILPPAIAGCMVACPAGHMQILPSNPSSGSGSHWTHRWREMDSNLSVPRLR